MKKNYHRLTNEHREELNNNPLYQKVAFEFRDGWFELINELGKNITNLCKMTNQELPEIRQIKEKFGTLRYYYKDNCESETIKKAISALVQVAESRSGQICEKCGTWGETMVEGGCWVTVCQEHAADGAMTVAEWMRHMEQVREERNKSKES